MDQSIANAGAADAASNVGADDFLNGFISETEYARQRGVTVRTCQRARQLRKAPPYVQFGRQIFYRIDAVREWLKKKDRADAPDCSGRRSGRSSWAPI